ncbi:transposase [Clostridium rectalis]|uniref:transposase n=1 Tax=Clostridium rectalis TaxID=2040295 RepID=UPI000F6405FB|nr:transposase [Clostridium rectalis]
MPRIARIKVKNGIYHVSMRSVSDIKLFKNNYDKDRFLHILHKYKLIFKFKVFSYCLMNTHAHILIHSNNCDISDIMRCINQSYAQYYNKKYNRIGHVFADRFTSSLAKTDLDVILMSAYIHNNPKDIYGYKNCVENYPYSSFSIFLGEKTNKLNLVDYTYVLDYFDKDLILSRSKYYNLVQNRLISNENVKNINHIYVNKILFKTNLIKATFGTKRIHPKHIFSYIYSVIKKDNKFLINSNKKSYNYKPLFALLIRCFATYEDIEFFKIKLNSPSFSQLCSEGYNLILNNFHYKELFKNFCLKHSLNFANNSYF